MVENRRRNWCFAGKFFLVATWHFSLVGHLVGCTFSAQDLKICPYRKFIVMFQGLLNFIYFS
jgi:hypothetical protein